MSISLFVDKDDEIAVTFVVSTSKSNPELIYAEVDTETLKEIYGDDVAEKVEKHEAFFRMPNFSDTNKIIDSAVVTADDSIRVNPAEMREKRISLLIKRWSLSKDKKSPVTLQDVQRLHPSVAAVIGYCLDKKLKDRGLN